MLLMSGGSSLLGRAMLPLVDEPMMLVLRGSDWRQRGIGLGRRAARDIEPISGDITAPLWGLDGDLTGLRRSVSAVVNVAAQTSWAMPRADLARANVDGARQGALLASSLQVPYIHLSTLFVGYGSPKRVPEELLEPRPGLSMYERTKWEGEWAVADIAQQHSVPVLILRVGSLLGEAAPHSRRNAANRVPLVRLLQTISRRGFGAVPVATGARLDVGPVDLVASAVVRLLKLAASASGTSVRHISLGDDAPLAATLLREFAAASRRAGTKGFTVFPAPARGLQMLSEHADRHGSGPAASAQIGLRYLASDTVFEASDGQIEVRWHELLRAMNSRSEPGASAAPYYRDWLLE